MDSLPPLFRLTLLGAPALSTADGRPVTGRVAQRHRVALLALLARAPATGVTRDTLMGYLWPESEEERARDLLKASVYVLRRKLGERAVMSTGDRLGLAPGTLEVDAVAFEAAVEANDPESAVALYGGTFLEGFFLKNAPTFAHWVDRERAKLANSYAKALEALAAAAAAEGNGPAAVEWWQARAAHDPFDTRVAIGLMRALDAVGSRAGALRHASVHTTLLREELGIEPSPELEEYLRALKGAPARLPLSFASHSTLEEESVVGKSAVEAPRPVAVAVDPIGNERSTAAEVPQPPTAAPRWARQALLAAAATAALSLPFVVVGGQAGFRGIGEVETAEGIARAVARELGARPPLGASPATPSSRTSSLLAWELYRSASAPEMMRSDSSAHQALAQARRAVALDPRFAEAHALLARLYFRVRASGERLPGAPDWSDLARTHAAAAVELDSLLVEGRTTLGLVNMLLYAFDDAESQLRIAAVLDPGNSMPWEFLVQLYVWQGRWTEALAAAESARRADPLSASARGELARALLVNEQCERALAELEALADLQPPLLRAGAIAAQCHAQVGLWDEAAAAIAEGLPRSGARGRAAWAFYRAKAGGLEEALGVLQELREQSERTGQGAFLVAQVYAGLGARDDAFMWLNRAIDDHSLSFEVREPLFSELHADPRFRDLLARLNLPGA